MIDSSKIKQLKNEVFEANLDLVAKGLVIYTWGNVSGVDRNNGLVVIKPSGIPYNTMRPEDMSVVDLYSGELVEGKWKPSSDTPTHLALYRAFPNVGGITHTHSTNAVAFAQAGVDIPALGTTHADYFFGDILCTRGLTEAETLSEYEANTGRVIIEKIKESEKPYMSVPGIIVRSHGPFSWGKDAAESVYNSVVMEEVADMAFRTLLINPNSKTPQYLLNKHYARKHGVNAYYGQK